MNLAGPDRTFCSVEAARRTAWRLSQLRGTQALAPREGLPQTAEQESRLDPSVSGPGPAQGPSTSPGSVASAVQGGLWRTMLHFRPHGLLSHVSARSAGVTFPLCCLLCATRPTEASAKAEPAGAPLRRLCFLGTLRRSQLPPDLSPGHRLHPTPVTHPRATGAVRGTCRSALRRSSCLFSDNIRRQAFISKQR